jgi:soluble lytic murein transglycosylase-like protein
MVNPSFRYSASRARPEAMSAILFALLVLLFAIVSHPSHPASRWAFSGTAFAAATDVTDAADLTAAAAAAAEPSASANTRHQAIAEYLSRRFQVAAGPTAVVVENAHRVGAQTGVDPLLILAVIAIESRFHPYAESVAGAKGLMQIIPKYHLDKLEPLGGEAAVLDPDVNLRVGAAILQEYQRRAGNLRDALQMYNGASTDPSYGYADKVLREKSRLHQLASGQLRT